MHEETTHTQEEPIDLSILPDVGPMDLSFPISDVSLDISAVLDGLDTSLEISKVTRSGHYLCDVRTNTEFTSPLNSTRKKFDPLNFMGTF